MGSKRRGKKAQITVFIVIGIVILLSVAAFFWFRRETTVIRPSLIVPPDVAPVKEYIESCLDKTAKEGLLLLGVQGGYIYVPEEITRDQSSYLEKSPGGLLKSPYWHYQGKARIPSEGFMKKEMNNYILNNMESCLNSLDAFREQFDIELLALPDVDTEFGAKKDVFVKYYYPIKISDRTGQKYKATLTQYETSMDVNFRNIFEYARLVINQENRQAFMENITMKLMATDPENIPFTGLTFHCGRKVWKLDDIRERLQNLIYWNIHRFRFMDTDYASFENANPEYEKFRGITAEDVANDNVPAGIRPEDAFDYFQMSYSFAPFTQRDKYKELRAGMRYLPEYGMNLFARPSDRGELRSGMQRGAPKYLSFMCINSWHFTYDVQYPVEVLISDPNAFNEEGYLFSFSFPVVIDHNTPDRYSQQSFTYNLDAPSIGRCEDLEEKKVTVVAREPLELFINDVNISYDCFKFSCELGKTGYAANVYMLETGMPKGCIYGWLIAEKEGYFRSFRQYKGEDNVVIQMTPKVPVKISIDKYHFFSTENADQAANYQLVGELEDIDQVLLNMEATRVVEGLNVTEYSYAVINKEDTNVSLDMVGDDAEYTINAILLDKNKDMVTGGYTLTWDLTREQVVGAEVLKLPVLMKVPKPLGDEEETARIMIFIQNNATAYSQFVKPELR